MTGTPLADFVHGLVIKCGIPVPSTWTRLNEVTLAQQFLRGINEYFYQTYNGIGTTNFNGEELQYFSEFHKFWETNHKRILNARINKTRVQKAAESLARAVRQHGVDILGVADETKGLAVKAIAQVRFFTANQDFREPPEDQYERYREDPSRFEAEVIADDPADFLKLLGMTRLSQTDKRLDFAKNAAQFLLARKIRAFDIATSFGNDAVAIREALVSAGNMGYGLKKANMFIRDMVELQVWPELKRFDQVDVASDINTMKVALRARIIETDIPLLSSFLDVFCYQYGYIDEASARAWRAVWEEWRRTDGKTAPASPCQMDYLLYRIGREYCKEMVVRYACDKGHSFYHFGGGLRYCRLPECAGKRVGVRIHGKVLPCQIPAKDLPREEGVMLLGDDNLLKTFNGVCPFETTCLPKGKDFSILDPPKSISIKGETGWTQSYAYKGRGGGGMMG